MTNIDWAFENADEILEALKTSVANFEKAAAEIKAEQERKNRELCEAAGIDYDALFGNK